MRVSQLGPIAACVLASFAFSASALGNQDSSTQTFAAPGTPGAQGKSGFKEAVQLLPLPASFVIDETGNVKPDKKNWLAEKEEDGTELFTLKAKKSADSSVRAAALKGKDGKLESLTAYKLTDVKKSSSKEEDASTVFFESSKLAALTSCEDREASGAPGRICVTATTKLCSALQNGTGVTAEILKEMDAYEMRALAIVLTLRGSDHQLDNVVKTGNRLGLKSALQTTKGQLMAIARQVQKEIKKTDRAVASTEAGKAGAVTEQSAKDASAADQSIMRKVLERSLPRLKQACTDGGFATTKSNQASVDI